MSSLLIGHIIQITVAVAVAALFVGAGVMFLLRLQGFTAKFKQAYGLLCIGLILYGLAQLQSPLIIAFNALQSDWITHGYVILPFLIGIIAKFVGTSWFAKLLDIKSYFRSFGLTLIIATVAAAASTLLPHIVTKTPEIAYDAQVGFVVWGGVFLSVSAWLMLRIRRQANKSFSASMTWMFRGHIAEVVVGGHYVAAMVILGDSHWYTLSAAAIMPYLVAGFCYIRAAYAFGAITNTHSPSSSSASLLDVVIYAASLVSNPRAIAPIVQGVSSVTANLKPGQPLHVQDQVALREAYLKLEHYLTDQEPIRKFNRDSLRHHIEQQLRPRADLMTALWR